MVGRSRRRWACEASCGRDFCVSYALQALSRGEIEARTIAVAGDVVVGRADACDLSLPDRRLSRRHARFFLEGGALFVEDLGSPNGTFVNGERIARAELAMGDTVLVGKTTIRVVPWVQSVPGGATEDETLPPALPPPKAPRQTVEVVRPAGVTLPDLESMVADDYFSALGIGADTLTGAHAERFEDLVRRTRNFAILHEVTKAIQRESDVHGMLARVLDLLLKVSKADRGYVALIDEDGAAQIEVIRLRGRASSAPRGALISQTVLDLVLRDRSAVICSNRATDARFQSSPSLMLNETRSLLAVPIILGQRLLGLLELDSSHLSGSFEEDDLDLVSIVCSPLGVALENLRLAERRERTIRELKTARDELVQTQERLIRSEQLAAIGRFATGIAHEVKNHLGPFMLADMIARRFPDDHQIKEATEMMLEAQEHILDLVNGIRDFVSGNAASHDATPQDLATVVEGVIRFIRCDAAVRRTKIALDVRERPIVRLDPRTFRQVLINLLRNASDALPPVNGVIRISVFREGTAAIVEVADNGSGISREITDRVFEPFFTTKGSGGLGLGLDISRKIVRAHGGDLSFTSSPGEGTSFRIAIPTSSS